MLLFIIVSANAEHTIDINSLINNSKDYTNKTVTVQGEAIGEVLERGDYAWVNINDGSNAIGIWMKLSDAKTIEYFGDNKHIGDTIKVTGAFSRDCTEHGGDVDIHSSSMEIVKKGYTVKDAISSTKVIAAAILFCVAIIAALIYSRLIKRAKNRY